MNRFVYQIMDDSFRTRGIFDDVNMAKGAALNLPLDKPSNERSNGGIDNGTTYYQINRIPINKTGDYSKTLDALWLWDGHSITETPQ